MRVIDLLNKIANGEEVPKIIKYLNIIFKYDENTKNYESERYESTVDIFSYIDGTCFDDEIEIIEEPKKIEKLNSEVKIDKNIGCWKNISNLFIGFVALNEKINEIIDYINKGDSNE